jgi:uncharacterized protein YggE
MRNYFKIAQFVLITCLPMVGKAQASGTLQAQTISVSGKASYNLSPNEIIVEISYQEYFTGPDESDGSKILIEELEKKVLASLETLKIAKDQITMGAATVVQPYRDNNILKRRINKSLYVCVNNSEDYIKLIRQLEKDKLFDKIITAFNLNSYNHTEKEKYYTRSRAEAFQNAKVKAELIVQQAQRKLGKVITIKEMNLSWDNGAKNSFYSLDNSSGEKASGFKPIVISYELEVVFEIL